MHWRDDASDHSLAELVDAVGVDDAVANPDVVPAIVVGGTLPDHVTQEPRTATDDHRSSGHRSLVPRVPQRSDHGDRRQGPSPANGFSSSSEIWLRDPPIDAETQLSDAGVLVRSPRDLSQVFNVTSFVTVRWAYATLSILGVLVGIVVLLAQLLVLDARRQTRQAAHVLTTRHGPDVAVVKQSDWLPSSARLWSSARRWEW